LVTRNPAKYETRGKGDPGREKHSGVPNGLSERWNTRAHKVEAVLTPYALGENSYGHVGGTWNRLRLDAKGTPKPVSEIHLLWPRGKGSIPSGAENHS